MSLRPTQLSSPRISSVVKPAKPRPFCSLEWAAMNCSPVIGNTLRTIGERLISAFRLYYVGCCNEQLRSEEHTSELQSRGHLVCRLLLEKKKKYQYTLIKTSKFTSTRSNYSRFASNY